MSTSTPSTPATSYKSLQHLATYPLISSTLSMLTSSPYYQKTLTISSSLYNRYLVPITPYLSPAAPYVAKADNFVDTGLEKVDAKFPVVRELKTDDLRRWLGVGPELVKDGRNHVYSVYEKELGAQKNAGVVEMARAGIATGVVVGQEVYRRVLGERRNAE